MLEAVGPADIVFTAADTVEAARSSTHAREVVALSLLPFARPAAGLPAGVLDYALEVPTYGDRFAPYSPVLPGDPAFAVEGGTLSGAELVEAAALAGLTHSARVLSTSDFTDLEAVVRGLLGAAVGRRLRRPLPQPRPRRWSSAGSPPRRSRRPSDRRG